MAEIIRHREAFDAPRDSPGPGNGITDEIHTLGLVDGAGVAFRQLVVVDHAADRFAFVLWG